MRRFLAQLSKCRDGATALEFALIAPVFFLLIWGILEICLLVWFTTQLTEGAEAGTAYMRQQRLAGATTTDTGLRDAICASISSGGLSCDAAKLKIGVYYAGVPVGGSYGVPAITDNVSDPRNFSGGQYILALGYNWGISLPTSKLLVPQGPDGSQLQARVYTVLAERAWDNGARP